MVGFSLSEVRLGLGKTFQSLEQGYQINSRLKGLGMAVGSVAVTAIAIVVFNKCIGKSLMDILPARTNQMYGEPPIWFVPAVLSIAGTLIMAQLTLGVGIVRTVSPDTYSKLVS